MNDPEVTESRTSQNSEAQNCFCRCHLLLLYVAADCRSLLALLSVAVTWRCILPLPLIAVPDLWFSVHPEHPHAAGGGDSWKEHGVRLVNTLVGGSFRARKRIIQRSSRAP